MLEINKTCEICNIEVLELNHFWREHKIKMGDYYERYFPKFDLLSGERINFRTLEQYQLDDFSNKDNIKAWLSRTSAEDIKSYLKNNLLKRKILKNLKYLPTQVELRSWSIPSIVTYNKYFEDYYILGKELGFEDRGFRKLKDKEKIKYNNGVPKDSLEQDYTILVDTRENKILNLNYEIEIKKLDFGDYSLSKPEAAGNVYIERKSIQDLILTLTSQIERFERELERVSMNNAYLVILVETTISNALNFNNLDWVSKKIKISPDFLFHNIREIIQKFKNLQFAFVGGRAKSADLVKKILFSEGIFKELELQLLIDLGKV